jgi:1-deoxy-D-xylulose-5-phosphate synthase
VALVAIGRCRRHLDHAAERLTGEGISCGVINARWLKPIDPRLLTDWARRYPLLVSVEDNVGSGGFGAAVLEALAPAGLAGKVRMVALPDQFLPHGKAAEILAEHGLDAAGLATTVKEALAAQSLPLAGRGRGEGPEKNRLP